MKENKTFLATFLSVSHAVKFEKVLKQAGYYTYSIPVPREISSSCGIAVRFTGESADFIEGFVEIHKLQMDRLYEVKENKDTGKKSYMLISDKP